MIEGCCNLLDGLLPLCDLATSNDVLSLELEKLFVYALSWAVGGLLEADDRVKFTQQIVSLSAGVTATPPLSDSKDTIFEFKINPDSMDWDRWEAPIWEYPTNLEDPDFSKMLVPTLDSTRASYVLMQLHKRKKGAMMTGSSGTAKTSTAQMFFDSLPNDTMRVKKITFSAATTPGILQSTLEAELDKRGGKSFGPPGGKKMTIFMDDLSMPEKNG